MSPIVLLYSYIVMPYWLLDAVCLIVISKSVWRVIAELLVLVALLTLLFSLYK